MMDNKNNQFQGNELMNKELIEPMIFDERARKQPSPNSQFIKPMDFDVRTKSTEEKIYIILYEVNIESNDNFDQEIFGHIYSVCVGRTEAYLDIKNKLRSGALDIDVHRSRIITETKQTETESGDRKYYMLPYNECLSVYSFCITVQDYYEDDGFDIEDYNNSDVPEHDDEALRSHPMYMTEEQMNYSKMIEASMKRDKFLMDMIHEQMSSGNENNI